MNSIKAIGLSLVFQFVLSSVAYGNFVSLPPQPEAPENPGSAHYAYSLEYKKLTIDGRKVDVFLPSGMTNSPLIIFGHGQAIDVEGYRLTFEHLAKKGVAVIHPQFDSGFFDQDWQRMGKDFVSLTEKAIAMFPGRIDKSYTVFSGHSKGGYVAIVAAGLNLNLKPQAVVLFNLAGYEKSLIKNIDPLIPVTLTWSDSDSVIKKDLVTEIYTQLPSQKKQLIILKSYPELDADHFFSLSKSYFFGGKNGISPFHYYGTWKWLIGAALDLSQKTGSTNPYLYGDLAAETGVPGLFHDIERVWSNE